MQLFVNNINLFIVALQIQLHQFPEDDFKFQDLLLTLTAEVLSQ